MTTDTQSDDRRALLQSALAAIDDLQAQLDKERVDNAAATSEPIAIIGLSCRFPGGASTPEAYWDLLRDGHDVVSRFPAERRDLVQASGVDLDALDADCDWFGGFLDEIDQFDPQFFGISPREAATMDPQQRLVLEVSWEALERAGIAPDSLTGSATGIYLGITGNEYTQLAKLAGSESLDVYSATGGALNAAPGRVAYTLGLQGPSMAIDTACSSSLVALHQACRSLRSGETDLALAGGVNLLLLPEAFICFERWGMMAPDGRCKTFDADADGFVRGEGCGMLVLKRLSDALADGDDVLAVVKGSAVNQDGRSSGLTVPNGLAQQAVLRQALDDGHVDPADVQYFEAHGTGTTLGDPIEIEAMGAVLGKGRPADRPVVAGSVKTNIGHLESASGIAGVIKVVLAMQHGEIPPHLHFSEPSPQIPWPRFPVVVPTELTDWPAVEGRRIAGVSGFGFSGTNAHVVLESSTRDADAADHTESADHPDDRPRVLTASARTDNALRDLATQYSSWISAHPDLSLADICATTNLGRARLPKRFAVVASSRAELVERLDALAAGNETDGVFTGTARRPRIAFMFTGQGAQYAGMARGLYDDEPVFRTALDQCVALIDPLQSTPLLDVIFAEQDSNIAAALGDTGYTQPALFAIEVALAALWRSWGVEPDVMIGHSIGELAAAAVAGVFSLDDAARLVVARGQLMQALDAGGAMVAVSAPLADVEAEVAAFDDVAIAAVNGPENIVISGVGESVAAVAATFENRGVRTQSLVVSHAFHSPLMRPMLDEFRRVAASITYHAPKQRLVSNVSGREISDEIASADYWVDHVMAPVRFADGMATLHAAGIDAFVEIGPHPVLTALGRVCLPDESLTWAPSLRRQHLDSNQILAGLATLFTAGANIDWTAVRADGRRRAMPTYPFQRTSCWLDPVRRRHHRSPGEHPLVNSTTPIPTLGSTISESVFAIDSPTWLDHHRLAGTMVFPGTGYTELVLAATSGPAGDEATIGADTIETLALLEPLVIPELEDIVVQTVVTESGGIQQVEIVSFSGDDASEPLVTVHARATVRTGDLDPDDVSARTLEPVDLDELRGAHPDEVDVDAYYAHLGSIGLTYGPTFQGLSQLMRREGAAIGLVELPADGTDASGYRLHPAMLDACFHVLGAAVVDPLDAATDDMYVPMTISGLQLVRPGATTAWCVVNLIGDADGDSTSADSAPRSAYTASVSLYDQDGTPIGSIDRLEVRRTPRTMWERALGTAIGPVYEVAWRSTPPTDVSPTTRNWVLVADAQGIADAMAVELMASGATCAVVDGSADAVAVRRGVATIVEQAKTPIGVVYLRGMDANSVPLEQSLGGALAVAQELAEHPTVDVRLWIVTSGAQSIDGEPASPTAATLWGLARVVGNELPGLACTSVDIDGFGDEPSAGIVAELLHTDDEDQVVLRSGRRSVARLASVDLDASKPPIAPYRLDLAGRGSFDALSHAALDRRTPLTGEIEVEVRATGLNFRDVLNVLGMYPGDPGNPGLECAGIISAVGPDVDGLAVGDAVVGIAPNAFDSFVVTPADLVVAKPARISFAEAATLPIAYLTAAYGLRRLADLQPGERVLIHAGAGGVGMAAIHIAHRIGAEVFTTVGSAPKRRVLEKLGVTHIYNSRTLDFADQILADTNGRGVDVVLNSLSDEFIDASFSVLAPTGRFLEIGKRGIWSDERALSERPDGRYHVYDLADFLGDEGGLQRLLQEVVDDIEAGRSEPLPLRAFSTDRTQDAFRFMAQARHIGKVVITHEPGGDHIRPDGGYVITGGLGGLGLLTASWLVEQGARHLTLTGRSAPTPDALAHIATLRDIGATVNIVEADVSRPADVDRLMAATTAHGVTLRGVFHAAGVTDDGAIGQQTWDRFERVLAPKLEGAALLDRATRALDLDHFVLFSSASAVLGAPGQSNYAAANSALDAIAYERRASGQTAVSVNWGAWAGAGMAARLDERQREQIANSGIGAIEAPEAFEILHDLLGSSRARVTVLSADWPTVFGGLATVPPLLSDLVTGSTSMAAPPTQVDLAGELDGLDVDERHGRVGEAVANQVIAVLGLDRREAIEPTRGFSELGMDSLMAVELSNRLSIVLDRSLPSTLPFEYPTLDDLVAYAVEILSERVEFPSSDPATPGRSSQPIQRRSAVKSDTVTPAIDVEDALLRELDDAGY